MHLISIGRRGGRSFGRTVCACLVALAVCDAGAAEIRFRVMPRDVIENRLQQYGGNNHERGLTLKRLFGEAGCDGRVSEQNVRRRRPPNVICELPGTSGRVIIVGAHFDRTSKGDGVADNWSGAALLPSLYEAIDVEPRRHTFVFIGFTDEEMGLVGSRHYARKMTPEQAAATSAMVNLDTLGLATTEVWVSRSDERLTLALAGVARHQGLPLSGVNFGRVGSTDSESFAARKIPRITIHTLTQQNHDADILHTVRDKLSVIDLDAYYDTYRLLAVYLAYLDHSLGQPDVDETPAD